MHRSAHPNHQIYKSCRNEGRTEKRERERKKEHVCEAHFVFIIVWVKKFSIIHFRPAMHSSLSQSRAIILSRATYICVAFIMCNVCTDHFFFHSVFFVFCAHKFVSASMSEHKHWTPEDWWACACTHTHNLFCWTKHERCAGRTHLKALNATDNQIVSVAA